MPISNGLDYSLYGPKECTAWGHSPVVPGVVNLSYSQTGPAECSLVRASLSSLSRVFENDVDPLGAADPDNRIMALPQLLSVHPVIVSWHPVKGHALNVRKMSNFSTINECH